MIRRLKKEVLPDLPAKQRSQVLVEMDATNRKVARHTAVPASAVSRTGAWRSNSILPVDALAAHYGSQGTLLSPARCSACVRLGATLPTTQPGPVSFKRRADRDVPVARCSWQALAAIRKDMVKTNASLRSEEAARLVRRLTQTLMPRQA